MSAVLLDELGEKIVDVVSTAGYAPSDFGSCSRSGRDANAHGQKRIRSLFVPSRTLRCARTRRSPSAPRCSRRAVRWKRAWPHDRARRPRVHREHVGHRRERPQPRVSYSKVPGTPPARSAAGRNTPLPDERSQTFYTMHAVTLRSWCRSWRAKDPTRPLRTHWQGRHRRPSTGPAAHRPVTVTMFTTATAY